MIFLLDSNVWIDIIRNLSPLLSSRFHTVAPTGDIRICTIVKSELWYGCEKSARPASNRTALEALISPFPSLPYDDSAADDFVRIRCHLETLGHVIGPYDMQIAAIALSQGMTLVTHNTSEFNRIPGLTIEDWRLP